MKNIKRSLYIFLLTGLMITGCNQNINNETSREKNIIKIQQAESIHYNFMGEEFDIIKGTPHFESDLIIKSHINNIPLLKRIKYVDIEFSEVIKEEPEDINTEESIPEETEPKRTEWTFINNNGFDYNTCLEEQYQYDLVPSHILNPLINKGWTFYLTANDLGDTSKFHVSGLCTFSNMIIQVRGDDGRGIQESTIHEVGHAVDYELGWVSNTNEFINIYYNERNSFATYLSSNSHHTSDAAEYFADAFKRVIKESEKVKTYTPQTYSYIKNIIDTFSLEPEEPEEAYHIYTFDDQGETVPVIK